MMTGKQTSKPAGIVAATFAAMIAGSAPGQTIELKPVQVDVKAVEAGRDQLIKPTVQFLSDPAGTGVDVAELGIGANAKVTSLTIDQKSAWVAVSSDDNGLKRYALKIDGGETQVKDGPATTWSRSYTSFSVPSMDGSSSIPVYMRAVGNPPAALSYFVPQYYEGTWKPEGGEEMKVAVYGPEPFNPANTTLLLDLDNDGEYRFKSPTMEVQSTYKPFRLHGKGYTVAARHDRKGIQVVEAPADGPELSVLRFGAPAPDWTATDFTGKSVKLSDFRGKFVFFDVWATWCGPCLGEIPNIQKAQEQYGDKVAIIGVSIDGDMDSPKKMVDDKKLTYKQYWAPGEFKSAVCQQYQVDGIPATFLVDPDGKLVSQGLRGEEILKSLEMASKFDTPEAKKYFADSAERAEVFRKVENLVEAGQKQHAIAALKLLKLKQPDPGAHVMIDRYLEFLEKQ